MKVLYIVGKSQYDSTSKFMEEMAHAMEEYGWQVDFLDGRSLDDYTGKREQILQEKYDVVFTMNGMLLEKENALVKKLLENDKVIYCTYLMDHPLIHYERLKRCYSKVFVLSPDRNHVEYMDTYMKNIYAEAFLPHAGCSCVNEIAYKERKYDISFMGSYNNPSVIKAGFQEYPQEMSMLMDEVAKNMINDPSLILEKELNRCLSYHGIEVCQSEFAGICSEFREVDRYVRSVYRDKVIQALVEAEITVHVFGDGWENFPHENSGYLCIHPRVNYNESLEIVADSKISLNIMPWFKRGSHDRVLSALLCGAVCLTDGSEWLEEQFKEGEHLYFYSLKSLKYLPMKVKQILKNLEESERVAVQGKALALRQHQWKHRAFEIIEYLEQLTGETEISAESINDCSLKIINELLKTTKKAIKFLRKQYQMNAMAMLSDMFKNIETVFDNYIKWCSKTKIHPCVNEQVFCENLYNLYKVQEREDYVLLADLLENQWIPVIKMISKELANKRVVYQSDRYQVEYTESAEYTLACCDNGNKRYFHSLEDPYGEAVTLAESWFDGVHFDYIVFGLGLGCHVQALLDIDESIFVTVIEPDLEICTLAQRYGHVFEKKYCGRVKIISENIYEQMSALVKNDKDNLQMVIHYPSLQNCRNSKVKEDVQQYFIEQTSMKMRLIRLKGNFVRNRKWIDHEVTELAGNFMGKTLYIIAAGPSLDRNMMQLKKVGNDGIILATGTVLKKLCAAGIRPDYVIITDGGEFTYKQTEGFYETDIPLLYLPTVYHRIIKEYLGKKYVICQNGFRDSERYAAENKYPLYETGGSVTTTALDVGIRLKCRQIVFVGLDLAYTNNLNHASGTADVKDEQRGNCMVQDIHGKLISTAKNLEIYRKWIEKRIRKEDAKSIEFIDATEGGARIDGTLIRNLAEVILDCK